MKIIDDINELSKDLFLVKTYQEFGRVFQEGFNRIIPDISKSLFYNFDWQSKEFELFASFGYSDEDIPPYDESTSSILNEVFEQNKELVYRVLDAESPLKLLNKISKKGSESCVPIRPFSEPSGVLYIYSEKENYIDEDILSSCHLISGMAARAIKRLNLQKHQIRQSKTAEKRYISQKNLMSEILNYLPVNVYMKDENGRYIFINKQGEETIEQYNGEGLGKTDFELFPKKQAEMSKLIDEQIRKNKKPITLQEEMYFDGRYHHMYTSKKLVKTAENKEHILGFSIDITDNINIQKDLEEQKRFVQQVLDASPNLIYVKDNNGNYVLVNQSVANLFNTTKENIIKTDIKNNVFKFNDNESSLKQDQEVIEKNKIMEVEELMTLPEDNVRCFHTTKVPLPDKTGKINVLCISVDITNLKKNEEELIKAKHAKEQFLANMSHEIRTPINGIVGMISLLEAANPTPEQERYIESIKSASQNLKGIITEILDFSLIESGKIKFDNSTFEPEKLFDDIVYSFEKSIQDKGLKFICNFDRSVSKILKGDPVRLNQIIINLISNAVKFTSHGYIKFSISQNGIFNGRQNLVIKVEDTGIGISEDKKDYVFESFKQADESINRKFGGTGLGLAICKQLAELQGGNIQLDSQPEKGSVFTAEIPFELADEEDLTKLRTTNRKEKASLDKIDFEGMKILLVEDNEINVFYARTVLKKMNCQVDLAENGKVALDMLKKNDYKLILMDLQMPELDGYRTTEYIRKEFSGPKKDIPIIAVTANALKGEREKCLGFGMNDYISKPFEPKTLENVLSQYQQAKISEKELIKSIVRQSDKKSVRLVDLTYLSKISDNDKAFMRDMIDTFIKNAPEDIKKLISQIDEREWSNIAVIAHKIKPAIKFMGIKPSIEKILKIEEYAKKEINLDQIPQMIYDLQNECDRAIEELLEILKNDFSDHLLEK